MATMKTMGPGHHVINKISCASMLIILAALTALLSTGCATGQTARKFKQSSVKTFSSIEAAKAAGQIDRYATSMIFFKLDKSVNAISISITAEYTADITGTKKTKKTYFIVEKIIDMSHFKNKNIKYHYAEIGRNYDADWNREKEITLVSSKTEPFRNLDGNSLYQIRFTTFSTENVDFTIKIGADCAVTFMDDFK